ncbi:MAG: ribbon-helix-helix protein, CopG family [Planctomycetota bacterium]
MRTTITISLPSEMLAAVEEATKVEHRTRSELIREALRVYLNLGRRYSPTAAELREIAAGRAAIKRGDFYTLDELRTALAGMRPKARRQKRRGRSWTRA